MEAIVLAGGRGTRLGALTQNIPKPMILIHGRPFLTYALDYWGAQGISRFIIATGYKREVIESYFGARYQNSEIDFSSEEEPLGTGGGLLLAVQKLKSGDPFLVLNGDTFFEVDLKKFVEFHRMKNSELSLALAKVSSEGRYERIRVNGDSQIEAFLGREEKVDSQLINGGIYLMSRDFFLGLPWEKRDKISAEKEFFPWALQHKRRFYGYVSGGRFMDIGTPEDLRKAPDFFRVWKT